MAADLVVLNKADLLEPQEVTELGGLLGLAVRDGVKVVTAIEGKIDRGSFWPRQSGRR